jgi:hypothetical protein
MSTNHLSDGQSLPDEAAGLPELSLHLASPLSKRSITIRAINSAVTVEEQERKSDTQQEFRVDMNYDLALY